MPEDVNNSPSPFIRKMSREERREYMRTLGRRAAEGRLILSADEREALTAAYALLSRIYQRHRDKLAGGEAADGR